jgi:HAD superfamily, subfamily IIIB (Acid phosphatase)
MCADDTTLASVYKSTRRAELEKRGYQIVGSFGDQYSDLEGLYSSVVNWKLPNPLYYIL